mgnify:CR=1
MLYRQINQKNFHLFAAQVKRVFPDAEPQKLVTGNGNIKYIINLPRLKDGKIIIELVNSGALVVMPMKGLLYDQGKLIALDAIFANFGMKKLNAAEKEATLPSEGE